MEIIPDTEEGGYTAWYPDLPGGLTCSETMDGIIDNARDAKEVWLKAALDDGYDIPESSSVDTAEYSGQFKLRIPKSLHRTLVTHAKKEGTSMNQYCIYLLSMNDAIHTAKAMHA